MASIFYHSGWKAPLLHVNSDGSWRDLPLSRTDRRFWFSGALPVPCRFVFTDGAGHWDNPSSQCTSVTGRNYSLSEPGSYAAFKGDLLRIREDCKPVLLITDLDGTLLEERNPVAEAATLRFTKYWLQTHYFSGSRLVYSTGRSLEEFLTIKLPLLEPDLLLTCVGSDAYTMDAEGIYEAREDYIQLLSSEPWDTAQVSGALDEHFPWLIKPDARLDFRFKTWRMAQVKDLADHETELKAFLRQPDSMPPFKVHISGQGELRYLDFTPVCGGKRAGVRFSKRFFDFGDLETVIAGDSGNDLSMLRGPERAVIPANRQEDVDAWFHKKPRENKYISEQCYADAIVEALHRLVD